MYYGINLPYLTWTRCVNLLVLLPLFPQMKNMQEFFTPFRNVVRILNSVTVLIPLCSGYVREVRVSEADLCNVDLKPWGALC